MGPRPPGSIFDRFWEPTRGQVGSKLGPSWPQNRFLRGPRGALGGAQAFKIDFDRFWEPTWGQVGAKLASESDPYRHVFSKLVLDSILHPLGLDFGHLLGSKMEPKNELNKRGVETAIFDSRCSGSSILNVPRG